jgi:hypothetical protein
MGSTIKLKTGGRGNRPSSLKQGEVAINVDNGLWYYGSGSNDEVKLANTFTNITSSISGSMGGHISASGTVFGNHASIANTVYINSKRFLISEGNHAMPDAGLNVAGGPITASGNISASGNITGLNGTFSGTVSAGGSNVVTAGTIAEEFTGATEENPAGKATEATNVTAVATTDDAAFFVGVLDGASDTQAIETTTKCKVNPSSGIMITGDTTLGLGLLTSHVTASGNISSSGNIKASFLDARTSGTGYKLSGAKALFVDSGTILGRVTTDTIITGSTIQLGRNAISHVTASGNISASGTIEASDFKGAPVIMTHFGNYQTNMEGLNARYYYGHAQGLHAGIWNQYVTDPTTFPCENQHISFYVPYDIKNVQAKVFVRGQADAQPAFWIYTGSLAEDLNSDVTLGWAASSSRDLSSGYGGHPDIHSNKTNAQYTQHITGSDSFDVNEGDIMVFYITNQADNTKSIRVGATIYGEKA